MKGMTLSAIAQACNGIYYGPQKDIEKMVSGVTTDSRKADKDSLFVAICGERSDGHEYIKSVYETGALCCISEKVLKNETHSYIKVESSLQALKDIAQYYRSVLNVKVIGITGSVGKTSTKETIAAVLSQQYRVLKTLGNFNNEIGLPLTIFRLTEEDEIAVLEMGISDFGEMTRLTQIAKPDICVITNIGFCHLENLKTRDGVLLAKSEIFKSMTPDGSVILNGDDDKLATLHTVNDKVPYFFGIDKLCHQCDYYAENIQNLGLDGMKAQIHCADETMFETIIPIPGYHMVYNALAATVAGKILGLSNEQIKAGIESLESLSGRNHIIKKNNYTIIDDCYNANPISMKASIDVISSAIGRKVCILGDMFELGDNQKALHYEVGEYLASKNIDVLVTVGTLAKEINRAVEEFNKSASTQRMQPVSMEQIANVDSHKCMILHFATRDEMLKEIKSILHEGDTILVKASHGMEFSKVVEFLAF